MFNTKDYSKSTKKVLHITKTAVAGAAGLASDLINRFSSWDSFIYTKKKIMVVGDYSCDYKDCLESEDLQNVINFVDLIHFHNCGPDDWHELNFKGKEFIIQLHSEPRLKKHLVEKYSNRCITIAQKHALLYKDLSYVPNMVPIFDDEYLPRLDHASHRKIVNILYAPTSKEKINSYKNTCRGKGYIETVEILDHIKKKYGSRVKISILHKVDKLIVLREKQKSDLVIDECVTGGYHLASLEGLSMGCITFANLSSEIKNLLCELTNSSEKEIPWVSCDISNLENALSKFIDMKFSDFSRFLLFKKRSRMWMERYWNPSFLVKKFINIYNDTLKIDSNPWKGLNISGDIKKVREIRQQVYKSYEREKKSELYIGSFQNKHKNRPILIIGNGPSVKRIDLKKFIKEVNPIIFTCNYYYKGIDIIPDYWFCIDSSCLNDSVVNVPQKTTILINPPTKFMPFKQNHIFVEKMRNKFDSFFRQSYELERPCTVVIPMLLTALYLGGNPIYTIGIDLSLNKSDSNYFYSKESGSILNNKFRDFSNNYDFIIEQFKLMKEDARMLNRKIYNLDPFPHNFKIFPSKEITNVKKKTEVIQDLYKEIETISYRKDGTKTVTIERVPKIEDITNLEPEFLDIIKTLVNDVRSIKESAGQTKTFISDIKSKKVSNNLRELIKLGVQEAYAHNNGIDPNKIGNLLHEHIRDDFLRESLLYVINSSFNDNIFDSVFKAINSVNYSWKQGDLKR